VSSTFLIFRPCTLWWWNSNWGRWKAIHNSSLWEWTWL